MQNEIQILRVSNGWAVTLPREYPQLGRVAPYPTITEQIKDAMPLIKQVVKMRDSDPLLDELQGKSYEPEEEVKVDSKLQRDIIPKDETCHVFTTFAQVLQFLDKTFSSLDVQ